MCFFSPRVHQRHNQPALNLSLPVECGSFRKCGWGICLGWTDGYPGAVSGNLTCVDVLSVRLVDDGEGTEVLLPLDRYPDAGPPTQVTQCCLRWDPPPPLPLSAPWGFTPALPALSPAVQCPPDWPSSQTLTSPKQARPTAGPDLSFQRECLAKSQDMAKLRDPFLEFLGNG